MATGKYKEWLEPDNLLLLQAWARDGLTDEQIAHNMDIAAGTLYEWKKKHREINESLKKGKEVADIEVENALFKRAIGYDTKEVTREVRGDKLEITKVVTKHFPGDVGAQFIWLKNRKPQAWRDKTEVVSDVNISNTNELFKGMSVDDLRKLAETDDK